LEQVQWYICSSECAGVYSYNGILLRGIDVVRNIKTRIKKKRKIREEELEAKLKRQIQKMKKKRKRKEKRE